MDSINFVDYIIFENTYLDPQINLGYTWNKYKISVYVDWMDPNHENNNILITWKQDNIWDWNHQTFMLCYKNAQSSSPWEYIQENFSPTNVWVLWWIRTPFSLEESYRQENDARIYNYLVNDNIERSGTCEVKYGRRTSNELRDWSHLQIGFLPTQHRLWYWYNINPFKVWEIKIEVDDVLIADLKPCLHQWIYCFYDVVRNKWYTPAWYWKTNSMLKTIVMTWWRQELPIDDWIGKNKIANRIIEVNKYTDWYAACYDEISISADEDNLEWIEVSDYTIENQINQGWVADFIELKPRWTLILPWNRQIAALNRPMVKWHRWDLLRIVVR